MSAAVSVSRAAEIQTLLNQLDPPTEVRVSSAAFEKSFPKKEPIDLYGVDLSDPRRQTVHSTTLAVQSISGDRRRKALEGVTRAAERLGRIDPCCVAVHGEIPAQNLLLYSFPLDPKLKHLAEAVSPGQVAAELDALGVAAGLRPDQVKVDIARYVPARRCQIRWTIPGVAGEPAEIYAKVYRDARGADVFDAMRRVHERLGTATPAPVAYLPKWNALLQWAAPGVTLRSLCDSGQAKEAAFGLAGRVLAKLHGADVDLARVHSASHELRVASHWCSLAAQTDPRFEEMFVCLAKLEAATAAGSEAGRSVVHRDCYDRQFLIAGDRAAIIDLDDLALGEPELDVGNFVAHIELRSIQGLFSAEAGRCLRRSFLESYHETSRHLLHRGRLGFYLATAFIRLAALYSMRPGEAHSSDGLLLQAGEAASAVFQQHTEYALMS